MFVFTFLQKVWYDNGIEQNTEEKHEINYG